MKASTFLTPTLYTILMVLCSIPSGAQSLESDAAAYHAYLSRGSVADVKAQWKKVVALRQQEFDSNPNNDTLRYRLVLAQYGLLSVTLRDEDEALFDDYVDKTEQHLEILMKQNKTWSEPKAILSGLLGLKIAYSSWKGMVLGPKSSNLIDKALKETPTSPLVQKFYGNSKLFTPELWGGDVKQAIQALEKSVNFYEESSQQKYNWYYLDARAFLGQAYLKNGQTEKAIACFEETLSIEPAFGWVEYSLLPMAKKKLGMQ